jgi:hypothetical protein
MSLTSAPFGLRPAFHPSGLDRAQALANGIVSGYATDILKGAPVRYNSTAGTSVAAGTITNAAASGAWSGAFAGVEFTDTTGRVVVSVTTGLRAPYIPSWYLHCVFLQRSKHRVRNPDRCNHRSDLSGWRIQLQRNRWPDRNFWLERDRLVFDMLGRVHSRGQRCSRRNAYC